MFKNIFMVNYSKIRLIRKLMFINNIEYYNYTMFPIKNYKFTNNKEYLEFGNFGHSFRLRINKYKTSDMLHVLNKNISELKFSNRVTCLISIEL
jgi:hypothetical protein